MGAWDVAASVGTVASAAAAAVATGLVAWQARLTGRANASARAVVVDSAKARLDQGAPAVDVRVLAPAWPPLRNAHDAASQLAADTVWRFPDDGQREFTCMILIELANRGTTDAEVKISGDIAPETDAADPSWRQGEPIEDFLMPGREPYRFRLFATLTARQWAENHTAHQRGRQLPHRVTGKVVVDDRRDEGVSDRWEIVMTGCPIEPVPDAEDEWRLADASETPAWKILAVEPVGRHRVYWISRRRGLAFPTVDELLR